MQLPNWLFHFNKGNWCNDNDERQWNVSLKSGSGVQFLTMSYINWKTLVKILNWTSVCMGLLLFQIFVRIQEDSVSIQHSAWHSEYSKNLASITSTTITPTVTNTITSFTTTIATTVNSSFVCIQWDQWDPTVCDLSDCSPPGSSIHGIFWARILE